MRLDGEKGWDMKEWHGVRRDEIRWEGREEVRLGIGVNEGMINKYYIRSIT